MILFKPESLITYHFLQGNHFHLKTESTRYKTILCCTINEQTKDSRGIHSQQDLLHPHQVGCSLPRSVHNFSQLTIHTLTQLVKAYFYIQVILTKSKVWFYVRTIKHKVILGISVNDNTPHQSNDDRYRTHRLISVCAYFQNCKEICA